jgi:hypothetical protein
MANLLLRKEQSMLRTAPISFRKGALRASRRGKPQNAAEVVALQSRVSGLVQSSLCPAGHRLESTVRYLGIEVDDALEISEQTEI